MKNKIELIIHRLRYVRENTRAQYLQAEIVEIIAELEKLAATENTTDVPV